MSTTEGEATRDAKEIAELEAKHREDERPLFSGKFKPTGRCCCGQKWPCDASRLLALAREALAGREMHAENAPGCCPHCGDLTCPGQDGDACHQRKYAWDRASHYAPDENAQAEAQQESLPSSQSARLPSAPPASPENAQGCCPHCGDFTCPGQDGDACHQRKYAWDRAGDTLMADDDLALIEEVEAMHLPEKYVNHAGCVTQTACCAGCDSKWPCSTSRLLAIAREALAGREDTARLDWLDSKMGYEGSFKWLEIGPALREQTLREYLDAARAATTAP